MSIAPALYILENVKCTNVKCTNVKCTNVKCTNSAFYEECKAWFSYVGKIPDQGILLFPDRPSHSRLRETIRDICLVVFS